LTLLILILLGFTGRLMAGQ
jgi:hypothetical protein